MARKNGSESPTQKPLNKRSLSETKRYFAKAQETPFASKTIMAVTGWDSLPADTQAIEHGKIHESIQQVIPYPEAKLLFAQLHSGNSLPEFSFEILLEEFWNCYKN